MGLEEHDIEPFDEGDQTVYRCTKCGRIQGSESALEIFRCTPTSELSELEEDGPPESVEE